MFQGTSSLNLDGKGRLSVPSRCRDGLCPNSTDTITITRHPDGCLMIFSKAEWEKFRPRVAALSEQSKWWKRIFLGSASEVGMDATGRVLIAPELREVAGLDKEVLLIGMGNHFELWDKTTYRRKSAEALEAPPPEELRDFSF